MKYLRCEDSCCDEILRRYVEIEIDTYAITRYIKATVAENVEMQNQLITLEKLLKLFSGKR